MATEATRELINAVTAGRMSRREFVIKALALGISVSGIISVLASLSTPAEAQSSGGTYTLLVSSSPDRSNHVVRGRWRHLPLASGAPRQPEDALIEPDDLR